MNILVQLLSFSFPYQIIHFYPKLSGFCPSEAPGNPESDTGLTRFQRNGYQCPTPPPQKNLETQNLFFKCTVSNIITQDDQSCRAFCEILIILRLT